MVFLPHFSSSFSKSQAPSHLPLQKEPCRSARICPGANVPLYLLCTRTGSHADTRTHACTHTEPLPSAGLPPGLRGLTKCESLGMAPASRPLGPSPSRPPSDPLPRLPHGPLTRSASSRSLNPAGQGHDLPPPTRLHPAPQSSPAGVLGLAVEPGSEGARPRAAALKGVPRNGAVAPERAVSSSFPPPPPRGVGFVPSCHSSRAPASGRARGGPGRKSGIWAGKKLKKRTISFISQSLSLIDWLKIPHIQESLETITFTMHVIGMKLQSREDLNGLVSSKKRLELWNATKWEKPLNTRKCQQCLRSIWAGDLDL